MTAAQEKSLWIRIAITAIRAYQMLLSPIFRLTGIQCRFHPSCSAYAIAVLEKHGVFRGFFRAAGRFLRCHPLNPGGFDPP